MNLDKIRDTYYRSSRATSQLARTLSLGGIAAAWLIGGGVDASGKLALSNWLVGVMLIFVVALTFDVLQYTVKTALWGLYGQFVEHSLPRHRSADADVGGAPKWINWFPAVLFWMKLAAVIIGYFGLALDLRARMS